MTNKYVVVELVGNNLKAEQFDDYDEAILAVEETPFKCLLIKVENLCDQGYPEPTIEIEDHT